VFIPIRCARLLLTVAPDDGNGQPDLARAAAFVARGDTVIHYRAGAWHSPLVALDEPAVLSMLMWEAGDARDCEEVSSTMPVEIVI
jgi:ureidoglycolate lyase